MGSGDVLERECALLVDLRCADAGVLAVVLGLRARVRGQYRRVELEKGGRGRTK